MRSTVVQIVRALMAPRTFHVTNGVHVRWYIRDDGTYEKIELEVPLATDRLDDGLIDAPSFEPRIPRGMETRKEIRRERIAVRLLDRNYGYRTSRKPRNKKGRNRG